VLAARGALFFVEIVEASGLLGVQVEEALGELVAHGSVTADSFNGLRALLTPQRRRAGFRGRGRRRGASPGFDAAGRWALIPSAVPVPIPALPTLSAGRHEAAGSCGAVNAPTADPAAAALELAARTLLRRYGVVCRATLGRETLLPSWRELLGVYRRWEARGEIRGGRFVAPLGGEQFALPEAVEAMRGVRRRTDDDEWVVISAADPLNLAHLAGLASRMPAVPWLKLVFHQGKPIAARSTAGIEWLAPVGAAEQTRAASLFAESSDRPRLAVAR